jgi:hypothetical protein
MDKSGSKFGIASFVIIRRRFYYFAELGWIFFERRLWFWLIFKERKIFTLARLCLVGGTLFALLFFSQPSLHRLQPKLRRFISTFH